ncbi:MAG: anti-sigma-B factor antagonist [Gemmatimonadota bacterium]|nr:MAG: anti-sigma-B factor antagonist [Gemmatimonadota bacterium]
MKIKVQEIGGVPVLEVSGEMYGGPENVKLVELLDEQIAAKKKEVVIDMKKVKWIASTGLGILVKGRTNFADAGGTVRLCGLNERVLTLLQITKMNSLFQVHDTREEALAAIQG